MATTQVNESTHELLLEQRGTLPMAVKAEIYQLRTQQKRGTNLHALMINSSRLVRNCPDCESVLSKRKGSRIYSCSNSKCPVTRIEVFLETVSGVGIEERLQVTRESKARQ